MTMKLLFSMLALLLLHCHTFSINDSKLVEAFAPSSSRKGRCQQSGIISYNRLLSMNNDSESPSSVTERLGESDQHVREHKSRKRQQVVGPFQSRRAALSSMLSQITGAALVTTAIKVDPAVARDELFKPNPLTNPVLEQIRIWDQAEADELRYGGELAPGSPPKGDRKEAYAKLLVPILDIQNDISVVNDLISQPNGSGLVSAKQTLEKPHFEKVRFKKIFNAFADNIYYSDPDRANYYLAGGATPKNEQSLAYLLRNDILTNVEALQAEITYLLKEKAKIDDGSQVGPLEMDDLYAYAKTAKDGMSKYLELVPPEELNRAKELIASR